MAIQVYECEEHGRFEISTRIQDVVRWALPCPECKEDASLVISAPHINVVDGTTPPR